MGLEKVSEIRTDDGIEFLELAVKFALNRV